LGAEAVRTISVLPTRSDKTALLEEGTFKRHKGASATPKEACSQSKAGGAINFLLVRGSSSY